MPWTPSMHFSRRGLNGAPRRGLRPYSMRLKTSGRSRKWAPWRLARRTGDFASTPVDNYLVIYRLHADGISIESIVHRTTRLA